MRLGQGNVFTCVCDSVNRGGMLSQHALQVVSQHALQQVSGVCYPTMHCRWYPSMPCSREVPGPWGGSALGGVCSQEGYGLLLWPSVVVFCYALLLCLLVLVAFWLKVAFWYGLWGQKAITEGHHTRRPPHQKAPHQKALHQKAPHQKAPHQKATTPEGHHTRRHHTRKHYTRRPPHQNAITVAWWRPPPPLSRPTPKGEIEGDQIQAHTQGEIERDHIQAHTQGGNWEGSGLGQHPRGKFRGIRTKPPPDDYCCRWYASYWNAFLFKIWVITPSSSLILILCSNLRTLSSFWCCCWKHISTTTKNHLILRTSEKIIALISQMATTPLTVHDVHSPGKLQSLGGWLTLGDRTECSR